MVNSVFLMAAISAGVVGIIAAWLIAAARTRAKYEGALRNQTQQATAAEARVEEVRSLLNTAREDFETLREQLREAERAKVAAETTAAEVDKNIAEQKALLEDARVILSDTFKSLASEVLSGSNKEFLALAEEKFKALREGAVGDLESRKQAV